MTDYTTMTHDRRVAVGREAAADMTASQWVLGDLALAECPPQEAFVSDEGALQRFADEFDIKRAIPHIYRQTAAAWPAANSISPGLRVGPGS
jgi:hypothetical protein